MPLVGIGHLTMLDTAPPDWVSLAYKAGFDAVGIRAAAIGPTEEEWPIRTGSPMLAETLPHLPGLQDGSVAAVCSSKGCLPPVSSVDELIEAMNQSL